MSSVIIECFLGWMLFLTFLHFKFIYWIATLIIYFDGSNNFTPFISMEPLWWPYEVGVTNKAYITVFNQTVDCNGDEWAKWTVQNCLRRLL